MCAILRQRYSLGLSCLAASSAHRFWFMLLIPCAFVSYPARAFICSSTACAVLLWLPKAHCPAFQILCIVGCRARAACESAAFLMATFAFAAWDPRAFTPNIWCIFQALEPTWVLCLMTSFTPHHIEASRGAILTSRITYRFQLPRVATQGPPVQPLQVVNHPFLHRKWMSQVTMRATSSTEKTLKIRLLHRKTSTRQTHRTCNGLLHGTPV